jgi:hypothetical protein
LWFGARLKLRPGLDRRRGGGFDEGGPAPVLQELKVGGAAFASGAEVEDLGEKQEPFAREAVRDLPAGLVGREKKAVPIIRL